MSDVGVVLKVPEATHIRLKRACQKHERSMQKVLLALIEGWVANGSPDPLTYGREIGGEEQAGIDRVAREGLLKLNNEIQALRNRIEKIEEAEIRKASARLGMDELAKLLQGDNDTSGE